MFHLFLTKIIHSFNNFPKDTVFSIFLIFSFFVSLSPPGFIYILYILSFFLSLYLNSFFLFSFIFVQFFLGGVFFLFFLFQILPTLSYLFSLASFFSFHSLSSILHTCNTRGCKYSHFHVTFSLTQRLFPDPRHPPLSLSLSLFLSLSLALSDL